MVESAERHVLCAVDLSAISTRELEAAVEMAAVLHARVAILHHEDDDPPSPGTTRPALHDPLFEPRPRPTLKQWLADALLRIGNRVPIGVIRTTGGLGTAIDGMVRELPADLLLLGSHGDGATDRRSLTERAIARQATAVLVVHDDDVTGRDFRFRRSADEPLPVVLVPVDFGRATTAAIEWIRTLAATGPLDVHLLHALPLVTTLARAALRGRPPVELADEATARLEAFRPADHAGRWTCAVEWGAPADVITAYADRTGPDLVVVGQHARTPWPQRMSGDTAATVLRRAWCPVLFVPGHTPAPRG